MKIAFLIKIMRCNMTVLSRNSSKINEVIQMVFSYDTYDQNGDLKVNDKIYVNIPKNPKDHLSSSLKAR